MVVHRIVDKHQGRRFACQNASWAFVAWQLLEE